MSKFLAFIILIISCPIWLFVGVTTLLFQGFPLFFIQERIGKDKSNFNIYKIRTMKAGKVTIWGKVLRNTGLDEFPQLLNILKGDMNFIGPRPLTKADIQRLEWDTKYHTKRWNVTPGITGLAQLSPTCHKKFSWFYDCYYSENKSTLLDLSIVIQTILVAFIGKKRLKKLKKL